MKKILFLFIILFSINFSAQTEDAWLFIKDKPNATTFFNNPITMLSQRALDRRDTQNVALDEKDVPIDDNYLNQIKNEPNITVLGKSKWLNAVHIQGTKTDIETAFANLSFLNKVEFANKNFSSISQKPTSISKRIQDNHQNKFKNIKTDFTYGQTANQVEMLKGDFLHEQGLTGETQIIAVIDAGFPNVNTLPAFQRLRDNNQLLGGYNFADRNTDFYSRHNHGTNVLSTIGGYIENEFVGTAPDAKFYLFISEIAESETVLEETLWVEAAERADSLGVDVVNTSLGYTTYDNPKHSHSYADMDGKTTFISRGAEIATSRGMLVVNSVGNSGNSSWKYMGAPADAPSVISVGAVDGNGTIASFSSFGPTTDNRIKPEIVAKGAGSAIINHSSGAISTANGTSFSSPIMAGLIACLNQNQNFTLKGNASKNNNANNLNYFLKEAVYESADRFSNPTDQYGYGIPNFENAFNQYQQALSVDEFSLEQLKIYPNPVQNSFQIDGLNSTENQIKIFSVLGKKVFSTILKNTNKVDVSFLKSGIYLLKIQSEHQQKTIKMIKK